MPWDALPEHINTPEKWAGTDWDNPWQRWLLRIKGIFAYSACGRSKHQWANWRTWPITLVKVGGSGEWRYENDIRSWVTLSYPDSYLSAIQYFKRWHFAVQWPFHVTFHVYFSQKSVPTFPTRPSKSVDGRMLYLRFGARRDADKVYWFPSLFLGLTWN